MATTLSSSPRPSNTNTPSVGDSDEASVTMPRSLPRKRIPSHEWEKKKSIITRLYQEEKRSLKEVMDILAKEHGFTATVKMFKSRIWKWGLDKKLKSDEVLAILILKTEREAQGRTYEFTIRGQRVDMDNINRYIRRNPSLVARYRAGQQPSQQTFNEVQCHSPPPSPAPSHTILPSSTPTDIFGSPIDTAVSIFTSYLDQSFTSGIWDCEWNVGCVSRNARDRSDELFERVLASFSLVNRFMMRKDGVPISSVLNPAFEFLKEIIEFESPVFAARTVCLMWYLDRHHRDDLLRVVMDYMAGLVPILLGQDHPMARIWVMLGSPMFYDYYGLATSLYSALGPLLEDRLGPANSLTAILYGDYIDCLLSHGQSAEALTVANNYLANAESTGKQHPWLVELAIAQTAVLCNAKESEGKYGEAMDCLHNLKNREMLDDQEAIVNVQLGNYSVRMGDNQQAVHWYREATRLAVVREGDDRFLLTCLANLEVALAKDGQPAEAERVRQYRVSRLSDFAKESSTFASLPYEMDQPDLLSVGTGSPSETPDLSLGQDAPHWLWQDDVAAAVGLRCHDQPLVVSPSQLSV